MAKRRRYDDKFRANAVLMLEAAGYTGDQTTSKEGSLTAVSRKLDVPLSTLRRWFIASNNPPPAELVTEKRFSLVAELTDLLGLHIRLSSKIAGDAMNDMSDADLRAVNTGIGILVDKLQLLGGRPTEIHGHAEYSDAELQAEINRLFKSETARNSVTG